MSSDRPLVLGPNAYVASCVPDDNTTSLLLYTDDGVEFLRTPEQSFFMLAAAGFPYEPKYAMVEGMRMHYVDEGPRDGEIVLMMYGAQSWCYSYRKLIPIFIERGMRAICVDFLGMGRSDKPVDLNQHSYTKHISRVKEFIREIIPEAIESPEINLIAQGDWGALIGLRVAADESAWFKRIIVANGRFLVYSPDRNLTLPVVNYNCAETRTFLDMTIGRQRDSPCGLHDQSCFIQWVDFTLTARVWTPATIVQFATYNYVELLEMIQYDAPYPSSMYRGAIRTFASMAARILEPGFGNAAAFESLKQFDRPFLVLAGELDKKRGDPAVMADLIDNVTGANVHKFEHKRFPLAGVFLQEDSGAEMAAYIADFIEGTMQAPTATPMTSSASMPPSFNMVSLTFLFVSWVFWRS